MVAGGERDGRLAPDHEVEQARRLRADGVAVRDGKVVGFAARRSSKVAVR